MILVFDFLSFGIMIHIILKLRNLELGENFTYCQTFYPNL